MPRTTLAGTSPSLSIGASTRSGKTASLDVTAPPGRRTLACKWCWPVVSSVKVDNPVLGMLGDFKRDQLNVAMLGRNQPNSQKIYDRVAWK